MDELQNDLLPKDFQSFASDPVLVKTLPLVAAIPAPDSVPTPSRSMLDDLADVIDGAKSLSDTSPEEQPAIAENKARIIIKALRTIERNVVNVIKLLENDVPGAVMAEGDMTGAGADREFAFAAVHPVDGRVVEGVFDGAQMVGSDGKTYAVPPNYASKSKLVEGDLMKLTITPRGSFIYKQIGPIERSRIVGSLGFDQTNGEFYVTSDDKRWSVIKASVTYYKGEHGDEVIILVPKAAPSKWAAVENIIKKNPL